MIKFRATWLKISGDMTLVSGEMTLGRLDLNHHSARENCRLWCHCKFPFQKQSPPLLRHLENFWPVVESVSTEKKENRNPGSNPNSNADLSYPNLSPLPLHCHSDPPKFRKFWVHKLANCLSKVIHQSEMTYYLPYCNLMQGI